MIVPYITIRVPFEYKSELQRRNKNKYHAFIEWLMVIEEINFGTLEKMHSVSFFAQSWGQWDRRKCIKPKSTKTVRNWMIEFEEEMQKFDASWSLKRWEDSARARNENSSDVKPSTQQVPTDYPLNTHSNPISKGFEKVDYPASTQQVHQSIIIHDDDGGEKEKKWKKEFNYLFMTYRAFNAKYAGKRKEALEAFLSFRRDGENISMEELKKAIAFYMSDKDIEKKNGFKNFFDNQLFFEYIDKIIRLDTDNGVVEGVWSYSDEIIYSKNDKNVIGRLTRERFKFLLTENKLEVEGVA